LERLNASTLLDRNLEAGRADKAALLGDFGSLTYGELAGMVARTAAYLRDAGIGREQRILLVLDDSPAFHALFLGAIRIGAVPIPVNPMDRVENYAYYLDDSYAKLLAVQDTLAEKVEPVVLERPGLQVLVVGSPEHPRSFDAAIAKQSDELLAPADTHADDMAFWLYSSGSTGRPKGVVHTQGNIDVTIETYAKQVLGIREDDLCYSTTKLFHAYGLGNGMTFPMGVGATAVQVQGRSVPDRILETVERYKPSLLFSVPALYAAMLKAQAVGEADFSSVRACVSAAEALPAAVQERWQKVAGVPILDGIGSTEMLHIYCSNTLEDLRPGTSGRPVPGYELKIVDESGTEVTAAGEAGDLLVRGDSCAAYYWHQRDKTRNCMRGDWFFTGDRYLRTEGGHFVYQGRADDMIKVGGLWVSPADVEACLVKHPAISEAAVIGVSIEDVSRIKAFVIPAQEVFDEDALAGELRDWCKEHLRRYEYPHVVDFVSDFPRTPTGKIQRFKLREAEASAPV
jgi:benzoate-CoA ligase